MSLPVKAGVGVLTAGTIASVGYFGYPYLMNNEATPKAVDSQQQVTTIDDLISRDFDYVLLDTTAGDKNLDKSYWTEAWARYQEQNTSNKDVFELDGWATRGDKDLIEELKKKCKLFPTSTDSSNYENVTKYCSRSINVSEDAIKNKLTILDISEPSGDANIWTEKYNKRTELKTDFETLSIASKPSNAEAIKKGCENASSRSKQSEKYQEFYNAYTKVCTKPREESK